MSSTDAETVKGRILLVDDDQEFHRLVRPLLEEEGFEVHSAYTGTQALSAAAKAQLLIIDDGLPDMKGHNLIRHIRREGLNTPVIYVSSLWLGNEAQDELIRDLDVNLIQHKPIVVSLFGNHVASVLSPEPREPTQNDESMAAQLMALRLEYVGAMVKQMEHIEQAIETLCLHPADPDAFKDAVTYAHRIRGTAGSYGFEEVGLEAGRIEDLLRAADKNCAEPEWAPLLAALEMARNTVRHISATSTVQTPSDGRSIVLLVTGDKKLSGRVRTAGKSLNLLLLTCESVARAMALALQTRPDMLMIDADHEREEVGFDLALRLRTLVNPDLPVIFTASDNNETVKARALQEDADFLARNGSINDLNMVLEQQTRLRHHTRGHILIIGKDASFAGNARQSLEPRGFKVTYREECNAAEAVDQHDPDLVLLDLDASEMNEHCRNIREIPRWQMIPILFLSANDDYEHRIAAFRAGANDYIVKPVVGEELEARLEVRMERSRLIEEQEELLAELSREHQSTLAILDQLPQGVMIVDSQGKIAFVSRQCRAMLGLRRWQAVDQPWGALPVLPRDVGPRIATMARKPARERSRISFSITSRTGPFYQLELEIQDDPRDPTRRIFYFHDVSELVNLKKRVAEPVGNMLSNYDRLVVRPFERQFEQFADQSQPVLIAGEVGSGRHLVARALHEAGMRRDRPFISVDCDSSNEDLLATRLFGHCRGAFTGAVIDQEGLFQLAHTGTLLLKRLDEAPERIQFAVSKTIETGVIIPVGHAQGVKVDVRVMVAVDRDPSRLERKGRFTQDMFDRLKSNRLATIPSRERRRDIPGLIVALLKKVNRTDQRQLEIDTQAMNCMLEHPWPGNLDQLSDALDYAVAHCEGRVISLRHLPLEVSGHSVTLTDFSHKKDTNEGERQKIVSALSAAAGHRTKAARLLGMSRAAFYRKLVELEIR